LTADPAPRVVGSPPVWEAATQPLPRFFAGMSRAAAWRALCTTAGMRSVLLLAAAFLLTACDNGTTAAAPTGPVTPGPGGTTDAGAGTSVNALGVQCTPSGNECPSNPPHRCVILRTGNPNAGYCSPVCATAQDCSRNYTGPGMLFCEVPGQPGACAILCATAADCPTGLSCIGPMGSPNKVCTTQP
jgi:hypothetical protein